MERPTREFLAEVTERAKRFGHSGDYVEVLEFIRHLYHEAGVPMPPAQDLEPYPPKDGE